MKTTIDWDETVAFTGYISQPKYSHISIPTSLTYRELFIIIGTLMLTCNSASLIRYSLGETIYGEEDPRVYVRDFDYNLILLTLYSGGMIEFADSEDGKRLYLTEEGKKYLCDNRNTVGIDFCEKKRQEAKNLIESARKTRKESNLKRAVES